MTKRIFAAVLAAFLALVPALAGDVATFVNLGFSPDSGFFMFGQYGLDEASGKPWAELYLVDTKRNAFVADGERRRVFEAAPEPGQELQGALFSLYADAAPLAKARKIDHLLPGRLLYALLDGETPPELLAFRDFRAEADYEVAIAKSVAEGKEGVVSSFGLSVAAAGKDGVVRRVSGGNPTIKRAGVRDYVIRRIFLAPDGKTMVVLVEKVLAAKGQGGVRYMVEAVRLP